VISQPFGQRVGVGNGGLPKAESNANLGTDALRRTAYQECFTVHRSRHVQLPAQLRDPLQIDLGFLSWEAAAITEEGQQNGEPEPRLAVLGQHQRMIGRRQSPWIAGCADAVCHAATSEVAVK
jgi:hypothetical protein